MKNKLLKKKREEKRKQKNKQNMGTFFSQKKMLNANEKFTSLLTMRNRRRSVTFYFNFTCMQCKKGK